MKTLNFPFLILLILTSLSFRGYSAVCTATANGNWNSPAVWSCGSVPGCGDIIIIPAGITVQLNTQVDLDENSSPACSTATYIQVSGTLQFVTGNKISLACGSGVEIMPGGSMLPGGGGGSSNWLSICEDVVWKTSDGPVNGYAFFGDPIPLSTEFVDFALAQELDIVQFSWTVKSERDNDYFEIEYSENGDKWMSILTRSSIGNHSDLYTYKDELSLNNSQGYYKLSVIDLYGKKQELKIRFLNDFDLAVNVYPNPATLEERVTIIHHSKREEELTVTIANSLGQIVTNSSLISEKGRNEFQIEINNLTLGLYIMSISNGIESVEQKLIIK